MILTAAFDLVLDPRLRSVVSLAFPYTPPRPPALDWRAELRGRFAAYALGPDHHMSVKAKVRVVADALTAAIPDAITRVYVDTGPVFEREWAVEARLGWFGRNTNLLNRHHGSEFFLAEILTDAQFEPVGEPYREHCGSCRQCLAQCPTGALTDGYRLERLPRISVPDDRTSGANSARDALAARQLGLRLRRLPGGLPCGTTITRARRRSMRR